MPDPTPSPGGIDALGGAVPQMDSIAGLGTGAPGAGNTAAPNPSAPKTSFLQHILKALPFALAGAAAGGAARTPGAGAAAGLQAGLGIAEQQNKLRFENIQAAESVHRAGLMDSQKQRLDQETRDAQESAAEREFKFYRDDVGLKPTIVTGDTAESAMAGLKTVAGNRPSGTVPNMRILSFGGQHVGFDLSQIGESSTIQLLTKANDMFGGGPPGGWTMQNLKLYDPPTIQQKVKEVGMALSGGLPDRMLDTKSAAGVKEEYSNLLSTYKERHQDNADPTVVGNLQKIIDVAEKTRANHETMDDQEAASREAAIKRAAGPIETQQAVDQANALLPIETEKARRTALMQQAITQGKPEDAGTLLANGDLTLSELKSRGTTPAFITAATNAAKKIDANYNPQAAEAAFNVAKSPENVKFFGSAKSLTDKGGTLDQLAAAAKDIPSNQIPVFNTLADATKASLGSGPIAKYASILLGVSDDYSKVMGGGQGSDASREQALKLVPANASPEARAAAIEGIRGAVGSQIESRIGNNKVMQRMYGTPKSQSAAPSNDPFAKFGGKSR